MFDREVGLGTTGDRAALQLALADRKLILDVGGGGSGSGVSRIQRLVFDAQREASHPHDRPRGDTRLRVRGHLLIIEERAVGGPQIAEIDKALPLEKLAVPAADAIVWDAKLRLFAAAQQNRQMDGVRPLLCGGQHNVKKNDHGGSGQRHGSVTTGRNDRPSLPHFG